MQSSHGARLMSELTGGFGHNFYENDWFFWPYFKDIQIKMNIGFAFFNILVKLIDKDERVNHFTSYWLVFY